MGAFSSHGIYRLAWTTFQSRTRRAFLRRRCLSPDDGMWCGMLRAPSPENLLHDLLYRTFTAMHCYRMDEAPRDQRSPWMVSPQVSLYITIILQTLNIIFYIINKISFINFDHMKYLNIFPFFICYPNTNLKFFLSFTFYFFYIRT